MMIIQVYALSDDIKTKRPKMSSLGSYIQISKVTREQKPQ